MRTSAQIVFEVLRRAGHSFNYTGCVHIGQSICNISKIANRKTQPQFENVYQGGAGEGKKIISALIFEIWTKGFKLLIPFAVLFLKKYKNVEFKKLLVKLME